MKNSIRIFRFAVLVLLLLHACGHDSTEGGRNAASFDVQFEVPAKVTLASGATSMQFRIMYGKAPLVTDKVLLGSNGTLHTCDILQVEGTHFTIALFNGMTSGSYNVYIQRGNVKKQLTKSDALMQVEFVYSSDTEIQPAAGSTLYGLVACEGKGLAGVPVSDGVEVVLTDEDGVYQLKSAKKYGYVFVTVPGGYEVPTDNLLPKFFCRTRSGRTVPERFDFSLSRADNDVHSVYILGDMHLANRTGDLNQFRTFGSELSAMVAKTGGSQYILTLGDMTWDLYWYDKSFCFGEYLSEMRRYFHDIPVFHTMGNHDNDFRQVGDFDKENRYRTDLGPTFYSFNLGKVHYIVLDDIDYNNGPAGPDNRDVYVANIVADQMAWLRKDLQHVDKRTPVVLASHAPLYMPAGTNAWRTNLRGANAAGEANTDALLAALKGYTVHAFTGHSHKLFNFDKLAAEGFFEHNGGAICGSWWWSGKLTPGFNLSPDGTPAGYTVWTVSGTDVKWRYKATGRPENDRFRSYDMNEVKKTVTMGLAKNHPRFRKYVDAVNAFADNEILLNVWEYDPAWKIQVTEQGRELDVVPVWTYDPLHELVLTAKRLAADTAPNDGKDPSFLTEPWNHFFKVKASSPTATVEIRLTDRFGVTCTESMQRPKAFELQNYSIQ